MSTLTWVLLILAAIVIGGVLIYNFIQTRGQSSRKVGAQKNDQKDDPKASIAQASSNKSVAGSSPNIDSISATSEPSIGVLTPYLADEPRLNQEPSLVAGGQVHPTSQLNDEFSSAAPSDVKPNVTSDASSKLQADSKTSQGADKPIDAVAASIHSEAAIDPVVPDKAMPAATSAPSVLSEEFDYLVEFVLPSPQSGERLLSLTAAHRRAGGKPVAFDGLLPTGQWLLLQPGQLYVALRAGLLMANRHGPLNAMEFSDFGNLMTTLGQQLDCDASVADMPSILNQAREVDRRCAELDAQLGINILTSSPTSPAMLGAVAAEHSLVERGGSRFARLDDSGATLFTLSFGDQTDRLLLLLDVPRAPANPRPWQLMLSCAMSLAQRLEGELVDDAGKPLPEQVWAQIEEQLRHRYWALEGAGIVPGSAMALRLFN
jgi:FtsZ-interacting cell division protein ZipA